MKPLLKAMLNKQKGMYKRQESQSVRPEVENRL